MTSSREFRPVWPDQQSSEFADLSLPDIALPAGRKRTASEHGALRLPDLLGEYPAENVAAAPADADADAASQAFDRGFADGLDQGVAQTYEKIAPALAALSGLLESLELARAELTRDFERNLYALALAVARHLIQREVTLDPTIVSDLVRQAVDLVPHDVTVEVRLNPDDLAALGDRLNHMGAGGRSIHTQWMADSALDRGSFLLETPLRVVDGRTDDVLRALYDRLRND
jgi:flagellar assembly protein FliH